MSCTQDRIGELDALAGSATVSGFLVQEEAGTSAAVAPDAAAAADLKVCAALQWSGSVSMLQFPKLISACIGQQVRYIQADEEALPLQEHSVDGAMLPL